MLRLFPSHGLPVNYYFKCHRREIGSSKSKAGIQYLKAALPAIRVGSICRTVRFYRYGRLSWGWNSVLLQDFFLAGIMLLCRNEKGTHWRDEKDYDVVSPQKAAKMELNFSELC